MATETIPAANQEKPEPHLRGRTRKLRIGRVPKIIGLAVLGVVVLLLLTGMYLFMASPASIRKPILEHYHFRMQILVDGKAENLGATKYQTPYDKDSCSAELTTVPIHLHDQKDQMVHIHWDGITGGLVLKNYGWNEVGGIPNALGYRFDEVPRTKKVPIHGKVLPQIPEGAKFYVFTGDENAFQERSFHDFLHQNLEEFFGKRSNLKDEPQTSWLDRLFPRAHAHANQDPHHQHDHEPTTQTADEAQLLRINNLIGNVAIFVQKDRPNDQQVQDRFNKLEALGESTCAG